MIRTKFTGVQIHPEDLPEPAILNIPNVIGGINWSKPPDEINPNESPYCKNVVIKDSKTLEPRSGYIAMSSNVFRDYAGAASPALHFCEYKSLAGTTLLVALNVDYLYYWDSNIEEWVYGEDCTGAVTPTVTGTLTMTAGSTYNGAGAKNYRVQIDGAGTINTFKWSDDGGSTWDATLVPITASNQELNNGITIDFSATTGGVVGDRWDFVATRPAVHFTGGSTDYFSTAVVQDRLCIANGVDKIVSWQGAAAPVALNANAPIAHYLIGFADRLFAGNIVNYQQRIQWCISGDVTDWVGTGSGYYDCIETADAITGLGLMGGGLVIFREESILTGTRTGIPSPCVMVKPWISGVGCYCPRSLVSMENDIYFVSKDPYVYRLTSSGEECVSLKVNSFFSEYINPGYLSTVFAHHNPVYDEYWLHVPDNSHSNPNQVFGYSYEGKHWTYHGLTFLAGYDYKWQGASYTFDNQPAGTFDTDTGAFDDVEGMLGQPISVFSDSSGYSHKMTGAEADDNGTSFASVWESFDLADPQGKLIGALKNIVEYYADAPVDIEVWLSVDGGATYSQMDAISLESAAGAIRLAHADFMAAGTRVRFRLNYTSGSGRFRILKIKPKLIVRGDHFPES